LSLFLFRYLFFPVSLSVFLFFLIYVSSFVFYSFICQCPHLSFYNVSYFLSFSLSVLHFSSLGWPWNNVLLNSM
jgi:hypothetical protein